MEELLKLLKSEPDKVIAAIRANTKDNSKIKNFIKEYKDFDRNQRDGQIEKVQVEKSIADGKKSQMVKIFINHPQNIVQTLSTFIIGKPITLLPSVQNDLSNLIKQLWRVNRMDSKLLEATMLKLSETQVAIQFYINDIEPTSLLNKVLTMLKLSTQAKEIKVKVLDNTAGVMTPYFDATGNMVAFMWEYQTSVDSKTINNVQIWDEKSYHYLNDSSGKMAYADAIKPHGFDRIPIAYDSQPEPQWYTVKSPADRHELALSKLGDSNDYSGHPILITEGEVKNMPLKEESGKHFNIPIKVDDEGKVIKGDVRFLEATTAPESNKLELDKLEDVIAYGSGVPNLSFEKLKSLGNVAEKTVKLMFLGTEIKAELKRSETRTFIERCINIMASGVTTTTNTALAKQGAALYYDVQFNSILPSDIGERVTMVTNAVQGGVMAKRTAIKIIDVVDDVEAEFNAIEAEKPEEVIPPDNTK